MSPQASGSEMRKSAPFTIQLVVLTRAPEVTAWVASKPCCWKKRTRVANVAGVPRPER